MQYGEERLLQENGLYGSGEDAENEEGEGKYYTWKYEELVQLLTEEEVQFWKSMQGVREEGNFSDEATGIPQKENIIDFFSHGKQKSTSLWKSIRVTLQATRAKRSPVKCDQKIQVDGNALYLLGCLSCAVA
jgi:uncharacterized protein YyaL (SSP411 family)